MANFTKAPWPEENANTVRAYAEKYDHQDALDTLEMIRNELFGNADRAEQLANQWGQNNVMIDCRNELDVSRENLAAYWQGGAYDSYSTYAVNIRIGFDANESIMNDIAGTMESCVGIVYDTYRDAIDFISSCAKDLADTGLDIVKTIVLPVWGVWDMVNHIGKLLTAFAKNVADLVSKAVAKMGQLREKGIFLARQANDFRVVRGPAAPISDPGLWAVKPKPEQPEGTAPQSGPQQPPQAPPPQQQPQPQPPQPEPPQPPKYLPV